MSETEDTDDELRMYFIVRKDIGEKMSKAKFGVQCGHAALMLFTETLKTDQARAWHFVEHSQPKIVLECADENELNTMFDMAMEARLPRMRAVKIVDLGRTELGEPTLTAIAIGPLWHKEEARKSFLNMLHPYREMKKPPRKGSAEELLAAIDTDELGLEVLSLFRQHLDELEDE